MLTKITKLLGPKLIKNKVAPIMMGKTILTDKARRAELATHVDLMSRRRDIWRAVNGVVDRSGIHDELSRVTAPTLVVVGDEDVATPRPKAEKIVAAIKGATLVTIPRAGHSSPVEEPALVTAALEAFLQALPKPRSSS
jgi:pimeloyl-ACP methyl ester carboxylesterase